MESPVPLEPLETPELLQPLEPPSLGDLKEKVKIPSVSLSAWSKFMQFCSERVSSFLSFWRRVLRSEITEQHSVNPSSQSSINASPKSSRDNVGNSNNSSATQASGNEVGNSIHDSSGAAQSSENNIENSSDESQNAAQPSEYYRKWNDELEETIKALQEFLENQCDTYFVNIKERTVKYFSDQYCRETRTRLTSFDAEFKENIDKQRKELKKLKKRIDDNRSELMELKRMSAHLNNLAVHLSLKAKDCQRKWT